MDKKFRRERRAKREGVGDVSKRLLADGAGAGAASRGKERAIVAMSERDVNAVYSSREAEEA